MAHNFLRNWYSVGQEVPGLAEPEGTLLRYKPAAGPCSAPDDSKGLIKRKTVDIAQYFGRYCNRTFRMSVVFDFRLK
jgi:hypothetical protein